MRPSKLILLVFAFIAAGFTLLIFVSRVISEPPRESKVINDFYAHRSAFEQLRNMLATDRELDGVAPWGVYTKDSAVSETPPAAGISVVRYQEYLALMKEIDASRVDRWGRTNEVGFSVWGAGFAGDTRHVAIAWLDQEPPNTVASLDEFYRTPKPRKPVYRHIDGNWYIWADW